MIELWLAVAIVVIMWVGGLIVGYSGFGFNLATVPLMALLLGPREGVVLTLLVGVIISAIMAGRLRAHVDWKATAVLLIAGIPGVAGGVALVAMVSETSLRRIIGAVVLLSALVLWVVRVQQVAHPVTRAQDTQDSGLGVDLTVGIAGGVMVAAAAMSGPPVVWLHSWRHTPEATARASTVAYITIVGLLALPWLVLVTGSPGRLVLPFALGLPAAMAGIWVGASLFQRFRSSYRVVAVSVLAVTGVSGLIVSLL